MEQQPVLPPAAPGQAAVEVSAGSFAWQPKGEALLHDIGLAGEGGCCRFGLVEMIQLCGLAWLPKVGLAGEAGCCRFGVSGSIRLGSSTWRGCLCCPC